MACAISGPPMFARVAGVAGGPIAGAGACDLATGSVRDADTPALERLEATAPKPYPPAPADTADANDRGKPVAGDPLADGES